MQKGVLAEKNDTFCFITGKLFQNGNVKLEKNPSFMDWFDLISRERHL